MPTLDECHNICGDFTPVRRPDTGVLTCKHLLAGGELCALPQYFRCEIKLWKERPKISISHSRAATVQFCERAWAFRYIYKLEPSKRSPWKVVGSAFALARAKIDAGLPYDLTLPNASGAVLSDEERVRLEAVLAAYKRLPRLAATSEGQVTVDLGVTTRKGAGVVLMGFYDGLSENKDTIYEWKYAKTDNYYNRLTLASQVSVYFLGVPTATKVEICVARKSSLVRHKATKKKPEETMDSYAARLMDEALTKTNTFVFKTYFREEFNLELEQQRVVELFRRGEEMWDRWNFFANKQGKRQKAAQVFLPTYAACSDCDWEDLCHDHVAAGIGCDRAQCMHMSTSGYGAQKHLRVVCDAVLGRAPGSGPREAPEVLVGASVGAVEPVAVEGPAGVVEAREADAEMDAAPDGGGKELDTGKR